MLTALSISLILIGCGEKFKDRELKPVSTGVEMPPIRADLAVDCPDPGIRLGKQAKGELARNRAWGQCERAKRRATVKFYNDVRNSKPKAKK